MNLDFGRNVGNLSSALQATREKQLFGNIRN